MRITTNAMFNTMLSTLNKNVADYQKINEQVATEKRINNPSDDAKGLSVSTVLKSQQSAYTQYLENIEEAKNYLNGADNALGQLQDLIVKVREFAQSNAQETTTPVEMDIAAQQIDQFLEEAMNIANTKINDRYIFAGYKNNSPAYSNSARILTPYAAAENAYEGIVTSSGEYTGTSNKTYIVRFVQDGHVGDEANADTTAYQISDDNGQTWSDAQSFTSLRMNISNSDGSDSGVYLDFTDNDFVQGDTFMVQVALGNYQGDGAKISFNTNFNSKIDTNISGKEIFEDSGFFDSIYKLKNALMSHNFNEIAQSVEELDTMHSEIQSKVTQTGINLNRLEITQNNLIALSDNVLDHVQSIEKVNIIDVLSQISMVENALNASITTMGRVFPLNLLSILK
ncbi:MAG TPA: flagellar hook-associated protein FlgL [Candidatus Cloacimonadota bacterium]|nr:flagellar hook-associated protein FlgL [Candidatus Cloacimonadota bacterium]